MKQVGQKPELPGKPDPVDWKKNSEELAEQIKQKDKQIEKLVNVLNMIQNGINTLR